MIEQEFDVSKELQEEREQLTQGIKGNEHALTLISNHLGKLLNDSQKWWIKAAKAAGVPEGTKMSYNPETGKIKAMDDADENPEKPKS